MLSVKIVVHVMTVGSKVLTRETITAHIKKHLIQITTAIRRHIRRSVTEKSTELKSVTRLMDVITVVDRDIRATIIILGMDWEALFMELSKEHLTSSEAC